MRVSVLGCGRWGTFHAWYAYRVGHEVTLWGRTGSEHLAELCAARRNEFLTLPEEIRLTDDLTEAIRTAEIVIISIHAQAFRSFLRGLSACHSLYEGIGNRYGQAPHHCCARGAWPGDKACRLGWARTRAGLRARYSELHGARGRG